MGPIWERSNNSNVWWFWGIFPCKECLVWVGNVMTPAYWNTSDLMKNQCSRVWPSQIHTKSIADFGGMYVDNIYIYLYLYIYIGAGLHSIFCSILFGWISNQIKDRMRIIFPNWPFQCRFFLNKFTRLFTFNKNGLKALPKCSYIFLLCEIAWGFNMEGTPWRSLNLCWVSGQRLKWFLQGFWGLTKPISLQLWMWWWWWM